MNFWGKKRKRHVLTFPETKLHAKNLKILLCCFPVKQGKRDRQRDRQKEKKKEKDGPEFKGPPPLSLSSRTKKRFSMILALFLPHNVI